MGSSGGRSGPCPGAARSRPQGKYGRRGGSGAGAGSPGSRLDLRAAALAAQRFAPRPPEGGSAHPMGRRAGPVAMEGAPPFALLPAYSPSAPARTPARVTQRRRTPGARRRRQRRGGATALFLLLLPGPRLPGCPAPPNSPAALPGPPAGLAATHAGGPPLQTTRARNDAWTHRSPHTYTHIHIHSSISTQGPQDFSLSFAFNHTYTRVCVCARRHTGPNTNPPILPHSRVQTPPLFPHVETWAQGHIHTYVPRQGTYLSVCSHSHPCTLTKEITQANLHECPSGCTQTRPGRQAPWMGITSSPSMCWQREQFPAVNTPQHPIL